MTYSVNDGPRGSDASVITPVLDNSVALRIAPLFYFKMLGSGPDSQRRQISPVFDAIAVTYDAVALHRSGQECVDSRSADVQLGKSGSSTDLPSTSAT